MTTNPQDRTPEIRTRPLAVGIIEDRKDIREGLAALIEGTAGHRLAGVYRTMEDALSGLLRERPDVILCDIGLPGMSGIEGIRIIRERHPEAIVLILSVYDDDERIFDALCAGATGYLLKNTPPDRLIESLNEAWQGGSPMSPEVARRVVHLFREFRPPSSSAHDLTPHEERLLKMLVQGHSYKSAAKVLGVSVNTISFHIRNIYQKLQVHSKSEAVARALRDGIAR
jgi:DNA-binding NarL/FixJ family response regulator